MSREPLHKLGYYGTTTEHNINFLNSNLYTTKKN